MSVSEQIISVLDNLCQKFGIAIDWGAQNVMPYLKELCDRFIHYEICASIAWMVFILGICAILWIIFATTFKGAKERDWDCDYLISWINEGSAVFAIIFSIISVIVIGFQLFDIIEAIYLPEKTIYDFITHQINLHN